MNPLPDVSALSASELTELINKCTESLDQLREKHMQEASLLGLHCALPDGKQRKPRRTNAKHTEA